MQEEIVIDDINIRPLARSEDDRQAYMPNAELINDSSEKFISIPLTDLNVIITGAVIETCTCYRQMIYTQKDIAYIQDIEALDRKINTLAETSHQNDIETFSMRNEFETVDEVNNLLSENYRLKNDLNHTYIKHLTLTEDKKKVNDDFIDGATVEGYYEKDGVKTDVKFVFTASEIRANLLALAYDAYVENIGKVHVIHWSFYEHGNEYAFSSIW